MASPSLVFLISDDGDCAGIVRERILPIKGVRLRVFRSVGEAVTGMGDEIPRLILVHLSDQTTDDQMASLLGKATLLRQNVAVVALSDCYDPERGATLFRLGVTDYVSLEDHRDRLAWLVKTLAVRTVPRGKHRQVSAPPR